MTRDSANQIKIKRRQPAGELSAPAGATPPSLRDLTHSLAYVPGNALVADARGIIQYVNPHTLGALGYAPADMIGQPMTSFWDQPREFSLAIMTQLERDRFWRGEIKQKVKNGGNGRNQEDGWERVSLSMVQGADDAGSYIVKIGLPLDHVGPDTFEARFRQNEMDLQALMAATPFVISIYRLSDRKYVEVNRAFCQRTGHTREEALGRTAVELGLFKDLADREEYARVFERDGQVDDMEIQFVSKSGQIIDAVISARRIHFRGEMCGITSSMDVTDLRKAQRALLESEQLYRSLMEAAPDNVVLTRLSDGKIIHANPAFYQHSGWTPEESLGRTTLDLNIYANPGDRDKFIAILRKEGRVDSFQVPVHFKDGAIRYELWSARVIEIFGEQHLVVVTRDISELIATRKALEESERNYRTIMEASPNTISVSSLSSRRYVLVNEAFVRSTGYSRQEAIGRSAKDLNLFADPADTDRFLEAFILKGRVDGMELRFRRKDGTITESLLSARTIQYANEPCVLTLATNIGPLKETERALSEREANYRTILETAPYPIIITRRFDATFMEVNEAGCRRIGYRREEIIGKTAFDIDLYENMADRDHLLETLRRDGQVMGMEIRFRAKDGTPLENLVSVAPIKYQGEDCLLAITVDISQQKAAERALRRSEQKYRRVLMDMEEGYWEVDLKGNFTFVNDAEGRIYRCPAEKLIGKNYLEYTSSETAARNLQIFKAIYRTGVPAMLHDYGLVREDGSLAVVESSVSLQKDENGKSVGFFGIARDITEKKKVADELERYRQHLEEMVRERTQELESAQKELVKREKLSVLGQLTATVSHELRNPLGVIKSSNFFLMRKVGGHDPKIDKHFNRIEEQVNLCDLIVADLLEYTRGRNIALEDKPITAWLAPLIEQMSETENITIEKHLPATLPPVPHDQQKMRRACINLIENAAYAVRARAEAQAEAGVDYSPSICVTTSQADGMVVIEVRDNGVGMDEATREHAFEPLFTTRARGTGIGLANVQKIVSEHNGDVSLSSAPGQGTTVTVKLRCKSGSGSE